MEQMVKEIEQQVKMRMESAIKAEIEEKTKAIQVMLTATKEEAFQIKAKHFNMAEENRTLKAEIASLKTGFDDANGEVTKANEDIKAYKAGNIKYSMENAKLKEENNKLKEKLEAFTRMEAMIAKYANPAPAPASAPAPAPAENTIIKKVKAGAKRLHINPHINEPVKTRPKLKANINFTNAEVREIRRLWALPASQRPSMVKLAEDYGAEGSTIRKIADGKSYLWVK